MGKFGLWFGGIFAAFGLTFAAVGGWFYWDDRQLAEIGETAQGTVTGLASSTDSDGDTVYRPRVTFTDRSGQEHSFTSSVGSSPPAFSRGEAVEVIYDPWSPDDAMIDSFGQRQLLPLAFGGMGSLFAAVGIGIFGFSLRRFQIIKKLRRTGMTIHADFLDSYRDNSMKVNGRSPYRVTAQAVHPATGKLHVFKSEPIWADLRRSVEGKKLKVLIDPQNAKHHYVDLDAYLDESGM